ncbi:MAG TPA: glycoside hydrolase family 2 TIM barrel-domain containing protein [Sphingobacterium sp.]|nr:glycoside hydrolase family 2 TIM barrel-domain containing protein [Sphingobacterium sp.]
MEKSIYRGFQLFICMVFLVGTNGLAQSSGWKLAGDKIVSPWAEDLNVDRPLNDYPRPQLVRENWQNLNGLWQYCIQEGKLGAKPDAYDGEILVPFAVESALSGVGKTVGKENTLWYRRTFTIDKSWRNKPLILHFGAVDWLAEIYINGQKVGRHQGGFTPFSFDISAYLNKFGEQEIVVAVWDPTNEGPQPNGKQVVDPYGIWYTPVTGIWQTVWLESVPETHIVATKHTPDIDQHVLWIETEISGSKAGDQLQIIAYKDGQKLSSIQAIPNEKIKLTVENPILWTPENPFLYDLEFTLVRKGKEVDKVKSYFAFRKISMAKDKDGIQRMLLNNEFVFQYGPLDQGWWPDGLYTAPTDEALLFDVEKTKEMGFNMIRKHIKVEPARWYYHCDRLGLLVWQDMPSGDLGGNYWDQRPGIVSGRKLEKEKTAEAEQIFKEEWKAIMDALHNFPSIVVWVPFNEAWGQFKTVEITNWTVQYDPSRLVNSASGGNYYPVGHMLDIHNYPDAVMPNPDLFGDKQVLALGEFGGLGLPIEGHTWQDKDNWGYQSFKNSEELKERYQQLVISLNRLIPIGLSAAVYTQTTDVEIETNGLMTYDRKIIKISEEDLKEMHQSLYQHTVSF